MRPPRADYDTISRYYDRVRGFDQEYFSGWLEHIARYGDLEGRRRILDVGCGTGRYAILVASRFGLPVVGLDMSRGMLGAGKRRCTEAGADVRLVQGDAQAMPFRDRSFDAATLILVAHHIEDLHAFSHELLRVLDLGGRLLVMTRDHDEIGGSYIALFPGVLEIDLARFPKVGHLEAALVEAGFEGIGHAREENLDYTMTLEEILAKVDGRFISTLSLMTDEEFVEGREVFERRLRERYGRGPVPTATFTFVWGDAPG